MATLKLNSYELFTQSGENPPVMDSGVDVQNVDIKPAFSAPDNLVVQDTNLPIFACRAWVHFNGMSYVTVGSESHCDIYASGNVSKVVRTSAGRYKIYFINQMPDTNYCVTGSHVGSTNSYGNVGGIGGYSGDAAEGIETTYVGVTYQYHYSSYGYIDQNHLHIAIFR